MIWNEIGKYYVVYTVCYNNTNHGSEYILAMLGWGQNILQSSQNKLMFIDIILKSTTMARWNTIIFLQAKSDYGLAAKSTVADDIS